MVIGIDTSNYTTSIAYFDGTNGMNASKLLPVKQGELGLRWVFPRKVVGRYMESSPCRSIPPAGPCRSFSLERKQNGSDGYAAPCLASFGRYY